MKIDNDDDDFVSVSEWANSKDEILNNDKNNIFLRDIVVCIYVQSTDLHMNRDVISD